MHKRSTITRSIENAVLTGLLLGVLFLGGCATAPEAPPSEPAKERPVPVDASPKELGKAFLREALRQYRFVKDPEITKMVSRVGRNIVTAAGSNPESYHFLVVQEAQLNAFAIPGGYIFVFQGLLAQIDSIEELAGVLAHETAHVQKDHFFKDIRKVQALELATIAAILLGGPEAAVLAQAAGFNIQLQYSRENEEEADAAALNYMDRAGYQPSGLLRFFEILAAYERFNPPLFPSYFSTHPGVKDRLQTVSTLIRAIKDKETLRRVRETDDPARLIVILRSTLEGPQRIEDLKRMVSKILGPEAPQDRKHYLLGLALLKSNQFKLAIEQYEEALKSVSDNAVYQADLAFCYMRSRRLEPARVAAQKAIALSAENALAHMVMGILLTESEDLDQALWHHRKAVALEPENLNVHWNLAQTYFKAGDELMGTYHLGRYARLNLQPDISLMQFKHAKTLAAEGSELAIRINQEIQQILQEGL